jgi:hypothetical protein
LGMGGVKWEWNVLGLILHQGT